MKSKILKSIGIASLCLAIVLGNVLAFSLGSTDGVWGRIDSPPASGSTIDASCGTYGRSTAASYTMIDVAGVIYNTNVGPGGENEVFTRNASVCAGDLDGDIAWTNWTRTTSFGSNYDVLNSYTGCATATGLIISKTLYESRDYNTDRVGIQIYNGTGLTVNLAGYQLLLFYNDRDFDLITLNSVDLTNGDFYVVAIQSLADQIGFEDQSFPNPNFIDQARYDNYRTIVLLKNYTYQTIDAIHYGAWPETVQAYNTADENMVRYGNPSGNLGCPDASDDDDEFLAQSGFGFEGQDDSVFEPAEGQYFPVGRFCHYNNPISGPSNGLDMVPLNLKINGIGCPDGQTLESPDELTFTYNVSLDETTNDTNPCLYGPGSPSWPGGSAAPNIPGDTGPNRNGCADKVDWNASTTAQQFTCRIDVEHAQDYTVSILGFTPSIAGSACPDTPVGTITFNQIYTAETAKNCYCVYAAYTRGQITPVVLKNLGAVGVENGILISWETVSEANNLGFNIMRAESVSGDQTQINPTLIMNELGPGGMFGAAYEYLDETAVEGVTYYYWLIDMPLDGSQPGIHGPISAER